MAAYLHLQAIKTNRQTDRQTPVSPRVGYWTSTCWAPKGWNILSIVSACRLLNQFRLAPGTTQYIEPNVGLEPMNHEFMT